MKKEYYLNSFEKMKKRKTKKYSGQKKRQFPSRLLDRKPSVMESKVEELLIDLGEIFVVEKTFPGLVSEIYDNVMLPLDFYLPKYKAAIEVDGKLHFQEKEGERPGTLDKRKLNDATRDLFCVQRGIKLLRLSYGEFKNYREIITEFINKLKNK